MRKSVIARSCATSLRHVSSSSKPVVCTGNNEVPYMKQEWCLWRKQEQRKDRKRPKHSLIKFTSDDFLLPNNNNNINKEKKEQTNFTSSRENKKVKALKRKECKSNSKEGEVFEKKHVLSVPVVMMTKKVNREEELCQQRSYSEGRESRRVVFLGSLSLACLLLHRMRTRFF